MSRWLGLLLSALLLTACTTVQEAYHTGAHDVLTALEAEVQQRQTTTGEPCASVQYRLPVVTRMTVPTSLVGGVVIPTHETYVVLHPGAWVQTGGEAPRGPGAPGCQPLPEGR